MSNIRVFKQISTVGCALAMAFLCCGFGAPVSVAAASQTTQQATKTNDAQLAEKVRSKIKQMYGKRVQGVHVSVTRGIVVLTGTVANGVMIDQAENAASLVHGIVGVNNQLKSR